MDPQILNLRMYQDRNFTQTIMFYEDATHTTLLDLTDYEFKATVTAIQDSTSRLYATFTQDIDLEFSVLTLSLVPAQLLLIPIGITFWDLLVTVDSDSQSYFIGTVTVAGTSASVL